MNTQIKKIDYQEMQEMLPDYIFNQLDQEDKVCFEQSLPDYPDLIQEVEDAKSVFSRLDTMNFDRILSDKTRNISVKVNNRMMSEPKTKKYFFSTKFAIPIFAIIIFSIFILNDRDNIVNLLSGNKSIQSNEDFMAISSNDALTITDLFTNETIVASSAEIVDKIIDDYVAESGQKVSDTAKATKMNTNLDNSNLDNYNEDIDVNQLISDDGELLAMELIDQLDKLDESEFQELLEEMN